MTNESGGAAPTSTARPRWGTGLWVLAVLVVGAIGLGAGHQWGLYDRGAIAAAVAAAPSTSPSSTSSTSPEPSASPSTAVAPACTAATKYVESVVRRSDLAAEHPKSTRDVTACRWVSETYPRITVSVVAGSKLDSIVGVLDDIWTDHPPMENPRMYQYADSALIGYWKDPNGPTEGAARFEGMGGHELPTDEGMAATSLAAQVAQAHRDR